MMTPYAGEQVVTTTGSDEVAALTLPGRCHLVHIAIARLDDPDGNLDFTFYSRAFTSSQIAIKHIRAIAPAEESLSSPPAASDVRVTLVAPLVVKVGDYVTLQSTGVGAYDDENAKVIAASVDGLTLDLRLDYTDDVDSAGTAKLDIPSAQQELYNALGEAVSASDGFAETWPDLVYHNLDPVAKTQTAGRNIGVPRLIYAKIANAGTYKVVIVAATSIMP